MSEDISKIREIFSKDRFATENGAFIEEVGERSAVCSLRLTDHHRNAEGGVMGGVHFMLADFTFAVACNHDSMDTVSVNAGISYMGAVRGNVLYAHAECVKDGRTLVFYRVNITDDLGTQVAEVSITGYRHTVKKRARINRQKSTERSLTLS